VPTIGSAWLGSQPRRSLPQRPDLEHRPAPEQAVIDSAAQARHKAAVVRFAITKSSDRRRCQQPTRRAVRRVPEGSNREASNVDSE